MGNVINRGILFFLGLIGGGVLGYVLNSIWFFFRLVALGYGDSGPLWVNEVNKWIWIFSILVGLIASQWYYHYAHKKGRL